MASKYKFIQNTFLHRFGIILHMIHHIKA